MSDLPFHSKDQLKKNTYQDNSLPFFMRLYPPVEKSDPSESNFQKLLKLDLSEEKDQNENNKEEKDLEEGVLTKEFLEDLIKTSNAHKSKFLDIIVKVIKNSKLIEKMEDDNKNIKKMNPDDLSIACAKKFSFIKFRKGEIIFKIGDSGDKFYYILGGKANILKIREIPNIYLSVMEYINYCLYLLKVGENYLFQEVIRKNYEILKVTSEEEVIILYRISFKRMLINQVNQHFVKNNKTLEDFFDANEQQMMDYNIDIRELEILEINKNNRVPLSYIQWKNYIIKKCELSTNELIFYEQFHKLLDDEQKKKISCYVYESLLFLGPGTYFGDSALDSEQNKRNATIRAEEDTYLASLRSSDYLNIIAPKRRYEKMKAIAFLFNTFFFEQINPHIFERNYFHLFYLKEFPKNTVLFNCGEEPKNLYLVKEGQITMDLKISIIEIHKLIKFLYTHIVGNEFFKNLSKNKKSEILPKEVITEIYKYMNEPKLDRIKMQNYLFIKEMNRTQNFRLTILMGIEALGLEEIFMKIPYLMKATVFEKVVCYELAVDKINLMLKEEKQIRISYIKKSVKKILSLIERLQSIKKNCVDMACSKFNKKGETLFDRAFKMTKFPLLKGSKSSDNMTFYNQTKKNIDNYKNKLSTNDNIDYKDDINTIMNQASTIMNNNSLDRKEEENNYNKSNKKEKKKIVLFKEKIKEDKEADLFYKDEKEANMENDDPNKYKKIQIKNLRPDSRSNLPIFKSPIRDFVINKHLDYKNNLITQFKNSRLKTLNLLLHKRRKKKTEDNSSFNKATNVEGVDTSNEKMDGSLTKPKLYTGVNTKNLFLLGDNKYYTIKKLRQQIRDFNALDSKDRKLEIIQSNDINNINNESSSIINNDKDKNNITGKLNIKKKLIKFSQRFNNFHLSFVPISVKYNEKFVNKNNNENKNSGNFSKLTRNSSYTEKFFVNKTMKNYFIINKKNQKNMRERFQRANSDLLENNKELPKIKNTFFSVNKVNKINITDKN